MDPRAAGAGRNFSGGLLVPALESFRGLTRADDTPAHLHNDS